MVNNNQLELSFVHREIQRVEINQRLMDGYINATEMCHASGKKMSNYLDNTSTKAFLDALSAKTEIPISILVQSIRGGDVRFQGTWVHPQVAINLAQWANPEFAVEVSGWVFEWMSGRIPNTGKLPYHLQRYMINRSEIPPTHFSIFNEIVYNLIAPLEDMGYELPDAMVPDISEGKMFADWIRKEKKMNPDDFPKYRHTYPDGRSFDARLYPNTLLADFREHFHNVWLTSKSVGYFKIRDINALPYLKRMLESLPEIQKREALDNFNKKTKGLLPS